MIDRRVFTTGDLPVRLKWIAIGWIVAEVAVFILLMQTIGFGTTVLLGLATTLVGIVMLRRLGTGALLSLRGALDGRQPPEGALLDGMLAGLGALLLILPGFLANFAGLALAAPSVRRKATSLLGGAPALAGARRRDPASGVIDLGPNDWRPVDRP